MVVAAEAPLREVEDGEHQLERVRRRPHAPADHDAVDAELRLVGVPGDGVLGVVLEPAQPAPPWTAVRGHPGPHGDPVGGLRLPSGGPGGQVVRERNRAVECCPREAFGERRRSQYGTTPRSEAPFRNPLGRTGRVLDWWHAKTKPLLMVR
jgi:hypothetical protein